LKLIDCFIFNNELDLLELRLNELDPVVDAFVLVESPFTFSGVPKPLYFDENKSRFEKFLPKIRHVLHYGPPLEVTLGGWDQTPCHTNERNQRDAIMNGLVGFANPEDTIWLSDLDEIPPRIGAAYLPEPLFVFKSRVYLYFLNYRMINDSGGTVAVSYGHLLQNSPNELMLARSWGPFRDGGWHFSYMGGASRISEKLESICHQEYNTPEIRALDNIKNVIGSGGSIFALPDESEFKKYGWQWPADGKLLQLEKIDDSFPSYLFHNQDRFENLIAQDIKLDVWSDKFK
jgi:beta-1,4-mannosyl-glycoprotein beta-1,4-N-acetylglucosaminyltransferase